MITDMSPIKRETLKQILNDQQMTQKQLYKDLHLSEAYCNRCLKEGWIATKNLIAIANALDVSPEVLSGNESYSCEISDLNNSFGMYEMTHSSWEDVIRSLMYFCGYSRRDADKLIADDKNFLTLIFLLQDVTKSFLNGVKGMPNRKGETYKYLSIILQPQIELLKMKAQELIDGNIKPISFKKEHNQCKK